MPDTPVLFVDGQLKGQIRNLQEGARGLVNIEPVDPTEPDALLCTYQQVHYRTARFMFGDRVMWMGWCGPTPEPASSDIAECFLSVAAKQLLALTPTG